MTDPLRIDIPLVLPEVTDAADRCVGRLLADLQAREGVSKAHVVAASESAPPQLCVHYDPSVLTLPRIRQLVIAAGAQVSAQFGHAIWHVGAPHARRARSLTEHLRSIPGVLDGAVSASGVARVEFDRTVSSEEAIRAELERLAGATGVAATTAGGRGAGIDESAHGGRGTRDGHSDQAAPDERDQHGKGDEHGHSHGDGGFWSGTELRFALACGVLLLIGFLLERFATVPTWIPLAAYVGAYGFGGWFTAREALDNLRMKRFEIDTLMLVAAGGAAALGEWAEGALLLFLFSFGHALEHYAMGRAKRAIEALAELAPRTATVRRGGALVDIPVEELALGDVVVVKPNSRLPADGFIIAGDSSIDQAPVTGESIPVDKRAVPDPAAARANPDGIDAAHRVFAGTINGSGVIEIEVTRKSSDSVLSKVVRMVSEAETEKSPTQRFTDRFERVFVPAVLVLAVLLLFAWVVVDEPFRDSFYRAMAVLVAASPCALAIATPSAVLSGIARAARGGVLVKGGGPLENLGSVSAIAFDKTGTLTEGKPRITDVVPASGVDPAELLRVAVAVESLSDHPLARAIATDG
ncbi:MAG TPA: HAD-IC family P-type ATPase, partial [Aggregatilineaceae bacterium]|nr:HAD-IC family P-type ATPase [Aggregatilineaceae bacterium]